MRQKFFAVPFAVSGNQTTVADPVDTTGIVTFTQGWGPKYSLDIADPLSLKIDRASTNYLFNVITTALAALQAVGTPEWITTSDNDGVALPYAKGACVRYSATPSTGPWAYYVSTVDANTSVPGADANWQLKLQFAAVQSDVVAGTSTSLVVTPASLSGLLPAFPIAINKGGTGQITAALSRAALSAAALGANSDITSLSGLTTALSVAQGGTGAATLTSHGVLIGEGTGAIGQTAAGTTGQMLIGVTGANPAFGNTPTITGGSIDSAPVGATTPSSGAFTTLSATTPLPIASGGTGANTAAAAITALGGVDLVNAQTIGGAKTFSTRPLVGTATAGTSDAGAASTAFVGTATAGMAPKRTAPNFANSGCLVKQRTVAATLTTSRTIGTVDNIGVWASGGAVTSGTIGSLGIGISGLGVTGAAIAANTVLLSGAGQLSMSIRMEQKDAAKYASKNISVSVRVQHNVGSTLNYVLVLNRPTVADNFASVVAMGTSSAIPVPSGTGTLLTFNNVTMAAASQMLGLELEVQAVTGTMGAAANFTATEFYVNIEATAGTYDAVDYETELARCQRYLPAINTIIANEAIGNGQVNVVTDALITIQFMREARVAPTNIIASTPGNFALTSASGAAIAVTALSLSTGLKGHQKAVLDVTVASGLLVGNATTFYAPTNFSQILFTGAEL